MRIKTSSKNQEIIEKLTHIYNFESEGIIARIAFALSLSLDRKFDLNDNHKLSSDGKEFRDERSLFGSYLGDKSNFIVYKSLLDCHYQKVATEREFQILFKLHLTHGLERINSEISNRDLTSGFHFEYLVKNVSIGLSLLGETALFLKQDGYLEFSTYNQLVSFELGRDIENNEAVVVNLNKDFEPQHMAFAGMTRSGKTELIKDILFQISENTSGNLKFIFFDYKGEGQSDKLKKFLTDTNCEFIDIENTPFSFNPLASINFIDERKKQMHIQSFVDSISAVDTKMGNSQKFILKTILNNLFENVVSEENLPTVDGLHKELVNYYQNIEKAPDNLYAIIENLSNYIFTPPTDYNEKLYNKNIYLNLPTRASDTLRQICVYLTLNYLFSEFIKSEPVVQNEEGIKPLRYIIVIDEAHVYLKNKSSRLLLESLLRLISSKGVSVVLLSQGVEDYKHKDFDFTSQIKITACLDVMQKDLNLIKNFIGTPKSELKLRTAINKLEQGKAIINLTEPKVIEVNQLWRTFKK